MRDEEQKTQKASFSHLDERGKVRMVDVGQKAPTARRAVAGGSVWLGKALARQLKETGYSAKGNVIEVARIAGIFAAKKTAELIPLCHPLPVDDIQLKLELKSDQLLIEASVSTRAPTGVEMEALTAVSVAALTVYDMCKAVTKEMEIGSIRLLEKSGGHSGFWKARGKKNGRKS